MPQMQLVENLSGTGPVYRKEGDLVGEATYAMTVYQEIHEAGNEELHGLKKTEGHVDGLDNFALIGKDLVLHLEDGRGFDFFIANLDGTIAARSGFYRLLPK